MNSVTFWKFIIPALLWALCFICSSFSEKAPYTFVHHAIIAPPISSYDYIIIGGGTAGCPLAATLSKSAKVLLLERGGSPLDHPTVNFVATFGATLADNSPYSASQAFVSTDGVINARARVLGGGSALNAGFYSRASNAYVEQAGWDQRMVNESYEWVEKKIVFQPLVRQFQSAVREGLLEAGVLPYNGFTVGHLTGTKVGGTIFDQSGRRHTSAELLEYADPTKITVYLYATVYHILFTKGEKKPRANGVEFRDKKGIIHRAILNKGPLNEVIVCAGALGSPQLLMLSGIGPKAHLIAHGIEVVLDQPMVGQVMSDNPTNGLIIPSPRPVEISLIEVAGITRFDSFVQGASFGLFGWLKPHKLANFLRILANQTGPHSKGMFSPNSTKTYYQSLHTALQGGAILEKVAGPLSTGHLMLKTRNPNHNPIVTFNYFKEPEDLQRCVQGMRTIIKVIESKAFSSFRYPYKPVQTYINAMLKLPNNLRRRRVSAAFNLEKFCVDTVMTIWHYHGGCLVGKVVDKVYKVIGVDGLRVIDGSAFRFSPGTNPQATYMMLGRYMGQKILKKRSADDKN